MALYVGLSARVMTNGVLSFPVRIATGIQQGCPLSPLLYVLVKKHLAIALRSNPNIHGITASAKQQKLALDAVDFTISIPNMLKEFERSGHLSNFKVYYSKTEALNISYPDAFVNI